MSTVLAPLCLSELDRQQRDLLVLGLFADERPLLGLNGYVDWRLNGRLSRLCERGDLSGAPGERFLTNSHGRLNTERILVYGLGPSRDFDNMAFVRHLERLMIVVARLDSKSMALSIPGGDFMDDFLLERLAILGRALKQDYAENALVFIHKRYPFKDVNAKFEQIRNELARPGAKLRKG